MSGPNTLLIADSNKFASGVFLSYAYFQVEWPRETPLLNLAHWAFSNILIHWLLKIKPLRLNKKSAGFEKADFAVRDLMKPSLYVRSA